MATSDTFATTYLKGVFGSSKGSTAPATVYVALSSTAPSVVAGVLGNITEPTNGSYARVAITNNDTNFTTSGRTVTNNVAVEFPTATANWNANAAYAVLYDAATTGNALVSCSLGSSTAVLTGVRVVLDAGSITLTVPNT